MSIKIISSAFLFLCISFVSLQSAAAKCIANNWVVTGKLEQIVTRNDRGKVVYNFHLVPDKKICLTLSTPRKRKLYNVRRLAVRLRNPSIAGDVKRFLGLNVTLRGSYRRAPRRFAGLDAIIDNATVVGAFDPRNGKFHNWSNLTRRISKKNRRPDYARRGSDDRFERSHSRSDRRARSERRTRSERRDLTNLIRRSSKQERYADRGRFRGRGGNRQKVRIHKDPVYEDIITFLSNEFLQFHQMHPADVAEYYAPILEFNGNRSVSRKYAIDTKFRNFRKSRSRSHELLRKTLHIRKSKRHRNVYHVRFQYTIKERRARNHQRWSRRKVNLILDLDRDIIQIVREDVRPLRRRARL